MNHTYFFRGTPHYVVPGDAIAHVVWDRSHHHICPTQPYTALTYTEHDASEDWEQTRALKDALLAINRKNAALLGGIALYQEQTTRRSVTSTVLVPLALEEAIQKVIRKHTSMEPIQVVQHTYGVRGVLPSYVGNTPSSYRGGGKDWEADAKKRWG